MMREGEVDAAAVYVQSVAEIFHGHRGALNMPARTSRADRRFPEMLARLRSLPESEVARVVLVVAIHVHTRAGLHPRHINFRQLPIARKLRDAEIDGAVAVVGESIAGKALNQFHRVVDMLGGAGNVFGRLEIQGGAVIEIGLNVFVRILTNADVRCGGLLYDAIVHIGKVHHLNDAEPSRLQIPPQEILKNERAEISDVSKIVYRGPQV